jgi:hypothetical protein
MTRILTASGRLVDPLDLHVSDVCLDDIAHHLAQTPRFGGATCFLYSVAEHSVAVANRVWTTTQNPRAAAYGLLHDAAEYLLGDVRQPVKMRPEMAWLRNAEKDMLGTIYARFDLNTHDAALHAASVREADTYETRREALYLMPEHPVWDVQFPGHDDSDIGPCPSCLSCHEAKALFLATAKKYGVAEP